MGIHAGGHREKSFECDTETELELKCGITGDWVAGLGTGYTHSKSAEGTDSGRGLSSTSTKYRFWRNEMSLHKNPRLCLARIFDDGEDGRNALDGE